MNRRYPRYPDDADYQTNAPSYYDDLARKNKLIRLLAEKIWQYEKKLNLTLEEINQRLTDYINENDELMSERLEEWDKKLIEFDDDVKKLLESWIEDGTMDHIINETLLNQKADKDYVDNEFKKINNNVDKKLNEIDYTRRLELLSFPKYGKIDFDQFNGLKHNINFSVWRDVDGKIKHNHTLDESGYVDRYVSESGANTPNNGKTKADAWKKLKYAIGEIEKDTSLSKVRINIIGLMNRDNIIMTLDTKITKDYIITADTPIGSHEPVTDWERYQGDVYKGTNKYAVTGVVRLDEKSDFGKYTELKKMDTLSDCEKTYNSFFSNGSEIFVHKKGVSSTNTMCLINVQVFQIKLSGGVNQRFALKDMTILNGSVSQSCYFITDKDVKGKVELHNIKLQTTGGGISLNGFMTDGIEDIKLFNCSGFDVPRDIFNYHNKKDSNKICKVFEYYCFGENAGKGQETFNNNISSAHEGIHIVRIGTTGSNSKGPLIADVNGCHSLNFDVFVSNTNMDNLLSKTNSGFYFNDSPTSTIPNPDGKAWLINCGGGSSTEWGINGDDSFKKDGKIFIDNFNGYNIPEELNFRVFEQKVE